MKAFSAAIIFLSLILASSRASAQGTVRGHVLDSLTVEQLKGAEITLTGTMFNAVSNTNGEFRIAGVPPGEYMLHASYLGYKGKDCLIDVQQGQILEFNVRLVPIITVKSKTVLTQQGLDQAQEVNQQISSNTIENVVAGEKLQDMPDENIPVTLSRLPGVSIIYNHVTVPSLSATNVGGGPGFQRPTQGDFTLPEDPVARILIRGLDSRYYNVTIDGLRIPPGSELEKSIDLNNISGRDFQNIGVNKTVTSDEDGDATAGTISLVTEKAPYNRLIKAEAFGNYNGLDKSGKQYHFTGSYGERFLNNRLGIRADANIDRKIMSNEYQTTFDYGFYSTNNSYTNAVRERKGADIFLDYITPDGGSVTFQNIFNRTNTANFQFESDSSLMPGYGSLIFNDKKTEQGIFLSSLKGSNHIFGLDVDWNAAFSESRDNHPYNYILKFDPWGYFYVPLSHYGLHYTFNIPSKYYSKERTLSLDIHKNYSFSNDITGELKFGGKYRTNSRSYYEYSRMDSAGVTGDLQYRRLADGTLVMKDFAGTRFDSVAGKQWYNNYVSYFMDNPADQYTGLGNIPIPLISQDAMNLWRQLTFNEYYANNGANINSYDMSQNVSAGYIMHTLNIKQLVILITGLRIENEHNDLSGYYFPNINIPTSAPFDTNAQFYIYNNRPERTRTFHYNKTTILPNFQMILKPTGFMNLRLAAYKTLIRPPSSARMPKYIGMNFRGGYYLCLGNPDLKNADVWNYEFQTQFYGNDIGQFSIDAFYKDIEGMVQSTNGNLFTDSTSVESLGIDWHNYVSHLPYFPYYSYNAGVFPLFSYYNSPKPTHIWGFEVAHQANFRYLPGLLKNIVLNYNFTFLRSESWITYVAAEHVTATTSQDSLANREQKLTDMPDFFANVNLGYDIKGFSFRISYYYQHEYPLYDAPYNLAGTVHYSFLIERHTLSRLDIAVRQRVSKHIFLNLNLNNITNSNEGADYTQNVANFTRHGAAEGYRYGMNIDLGVGIDL